MPCFLDLTIKQYTQFNNCIPILNKNLEAISRDQQYHETNLYVQLKAHTQKGVILSDLKTRQLCIFIVLEPVDKKI